MPEVSRDQLNQMLDKVPENEHEQFLTHLKGQGYTLQGSVSPTNGLQGPQTSKNGQAPGWKERFAPTISKIARPLLEVGGAVGGGALAGGANAPDVFGVIPGAAAGGALGFAGGRTAADALDRTLGVKPHIKSISQAGKEVAGNLAAGAGMEVGGAALGKLAEGAALIGKGLLSVLFGPSMKAIDARFLNNAAIKEAKPFDTLAKELPKDVEKLASKVGEFHDTALRTLSKSKAMIQTAEDEGRAVTRDIVLKAVNSEKAKLGRAISDASFAAKATLEKYAMRLEKLGPTASENELGHIVRDIDHDIDWEKGGNEPTNKALEGLRTKLDRLLKMRNPGYSKAMEPVADGTRLLNKSKQVFLLKKEGKNLVPSDATVARLKNVVGPARIYSQDVLKALQAVTGRDYTQAVENAHVADQFIKGSIQGSRRVNLGGAIGSAVGGGVGALLGHPGAGMAIGATGGALGGAVQDTYGPAMAGKIVDQLVNLKKMGIQIPPGVITRAISAALVPNTNENRSNQ